MKHYDDGSDISSGCTEKPVSTKARVASASGDALALVKMRRLVIALSVVAVLGVGVAVWALMFGGPDELMVPDRAPAMDEAAVSMGDEDDEKMKQPEGGGAVNITFSDEVTVDLTAGEAYLMFANPTRSNQGMVVQLVVHDIAMAQSDLIEPGYQINQLTLANVANKLQGGDYDGSLRVYFYDLESGEQASVNTEIPVGVTVRSS